MRRLSAAAAAVGLLSLALVGCSAPGAQTCDRPTPVGDIGSLVTVDGEVGSAPDIQVPTSLVLDGLQYADVATGDGRAIVSSSQVADLGFSIVDVASGQTVLTQGYAQQPFYVPLTGILQTLPGLEEALMCTPGGSRVVVGLPTDQIAPDVVQQLRLGENDALVAVIDVRDVMLVAADGVPQYNDARGLPSVVLDPEGRPGVVIPDAAPPSERTVQVLKRGEHDVPADNAQVVINALQVDWSTRTVDSSTWESGATAVDLSTQSSVADALRGLPVGSQVLIVDTDDSGKTTVTVVDLLGSLT